MTDDADGPTRSPLLLAAAVASVVVGAALLVAGLFNAFSDDDTSATATATSVESSLPAVTDPVAEGRDPLPGFGEIALRVFAGGDDAEEFCVLLAETDEQRRRGLMEVTDTDLGGYDGMLFDYGEEREGAFWMRNTPMPLSIAFADGDGEVIDAFDMEPCEDSPDCPSYPASGPFRYAVEVPQGNLARLGLAEGSRLETAGACAPAG